MRIFAALLSAAAAQLMVPQNSVEEREAAYLAAKAAKEGVAGEMLTEARTEGGFIRVTSSDVKFCDATAKRHSGYYEFDGPQGKTSYFFTLFESRRDPATDPLVMWLTGGPGCSSMLAMLTENGPCRITGDGSKLSDWTTSKTSWTESANVFWLDQPAGVGFSKGPHIVDEDGVGANAYGFMQALLKALPQFQKNPFFVTGESYGGHYTIAVANAIFNSWKDLPKGDVKINLAGVAIGNGLSDPHAQYPAYPTMALNGGEKEGGSLIPHGGKGAITKDQYDEMMSKLPECEKLIAECNEPKEETEVCTKAQQFCNAAMMTYYTQSGRNPYDMREPCAPGTDLCYDFSRETTWLNSDEVKKALGADASIQWQSCNMQVNAEFSRDWMRSLSAQVGPMLEGGVRFLVYAGDVDFIVNWLGCKNFALDIEHSKKDEFNAAADAAYMMNGEQVGRLRQAGNLSYMQVYQAGHMVPMNQPEVGLQMINQFMSNTLGQSSMEVVV